MTIRAQDRQRARDFRREAGGGVAITFALAAPVLAVAVAVAVDYARFTDLRRKMQTAADSAALAATREMRLAQNDPNRVATVARQFVDTHLAAQGLGDYQVQASPTSGGPSPATPAPGTPVLPSLARTESRTAGDPMMVELSPPSPSGGPGGGSTAYAGPGVDVAISMQTTGVFAALLGQGAVTINVRAQARPTGSLPICMIALDPVENRAMMLEVAARLEAPACAVYSDSVASAGLSVTGSSVLRSGFICSSGGSEGAGGNFSPLPQVDCPAVPDPLAARPAPPVGACNHVDLTVSGGVRTLMPGVYCGGLRIAGTADVTFAPGVYVIKDGPFEVTGRATARGSYVGFYLTGPGALINFTGAATVEMSAPKVGPMAGLLFFEDRAAAPATHEVAADNVRVLLGTVYLSRGELRVSSRNRVGDMSAYTVVVARKIRATGTPALFLNAAYSASDVPVPEGLGPNGGGARLVR